MKNECGAPVATMEVHAKSAARIVAEVSSRLQQAVSASDPNRWTMACAVFVLIYSLYSWSPLMRAGWSIIDDHEIAATIGTRARLPLSEVPKAVAGTEAGATASNRYRPVYYSLRIFEMAIWGNNPQLWFAFRIVLGIASFILLAICSIRLAGPILGTGFVVFELLQTYWADIYTRLGPAEVFGFFGACLVAWQAFAKNGAWSLQRYLLICAGVVLAVGSKENFIFLGLVPAWLLWTRWTGMPAAARISCIAALVFAAWIVLVVVKGVLIAGQDVYANDASAGGRLRLLTSFMMRREVQVWSLACAGVFLFRAWLSRSKSAGEWASRVEPKDLAQKDLAQVAGLLAGLLVIYASQYVFYSGKWPEKSLGRYMVPGLVAAHLAVLVVLVGLQRAVAKLAPSWATAASIIGALLLIGNVAHKWNGNHSRARETAVTTSTFTRNVAEAAEFLRKHPQAIIVVNSHSPVDYEPVQALPRFLRAAGIENRMVLHLAGYHSGLPAIKAEPLARQLVEQLEKQQADGAGNIYVPRQSVDAAADCFSFGLSGPPASQCARGNRIWR